MNSSAQQIAEEFADSVNNLKDLQEPTNTANRPNHPAGYVRAKIGHKALLVKCLIDSGNLFGNLISENLAKTLRVRYKGVENEGDEAEPEQVLCSQEGSRIPRPYGIG